MSKSENRRDKNTASRKKKQAAYLEAFKKKQKSLGFKELRGAEIHDDDKPYVELLIDIVNEARRSEVEDSDIVFRIDNLGDYSIVAPDSVFVIIDRKRYRLPQTQRVIPAGSSLIVRRGDIAKLRKDEGLAA